MAPDSAAAGDIARDFDTGSLVRTASWGIGAAAALFLAVLAGISQSGSPRVAVALATLTGKLEPVAAKSAPAPAPVAAVQPPQPNPEARRLTEQVRLLAADRDRLAQRVNILERSIEDVTGSIRRQEEAIKAAAQSVEEPPPAAPAATAAAPWPALPIQPPAHSPWTTPPAPQPEPGPETTAALPAAAPHPPATPLPLPRPSAAVLPEAEQGAPADTSELPSRHANVAPKPEPPPSRPSYGVDLGGAASVDRLRMLWQSLRTNEPKLLGALRPVTHVREVRRGGRPDLRLIAGPLSSADDAARLCGAILNAGRYCEPALFHGQRLLR